MRKQIQYKGIDISYSDEGSGACLFLLHGYLETADIWEGFVPRLSPQFRVISMDIPGHGSSGCWGREHSMPELAASVKSIMDEEGIQKIVLLGHSMGGYICMEFAARYPERLYAYVLFHSTCFADTEEKKLNRDREISLVLCGRKKQIVNVNIPKAFADSNVERLEKEIRRCQDLALENEDEGVVALLNGMKNRADHSETLSDDSLPLLLIGGEKDNYIPIEVFEKLRIMAPHASVLRLRESGHMGFIEEAELSAEALLTFALSHAEFK